MGQFLFDQYSLLHFAMGVVNYFWGAKPLTWLVSHALFELAENTEPGMAFINKYITFWPGGKPEADSWMNILGDNISRRATGLQAPPKIAMSGHVDRHRIGVHIDHGPYEERRHCDREDGAPKQALAEIDDFHFDRSLQ